MIMADNGRKCTRPRTILLDEDQLFTKKFKPKPTTHEQQHE